MFSIDGSGNGIIEVTEESLGIEDGEEVSILWERSGKAETLKDVVDGENVIHPPA
ncbi:MAG: hypothetical protein JW778_03315 [Candidatus Altiarchaeota archaeon]|nr:hypothetical protein [Candidatus Altiarchaeota archaeon]